MTSFENPFDQHAIAYDAWFDSPEGAAMFAIELSCLQQEMGFIAGQWLEVGIGSGRFAEALGIGTGVDPSPQMVQLARTRGIESCVGCAEALPFDNAFYDGVVMLFALCFLSNPLQAMREAHCILKIGYRLYSR